MPKAHIEMSLDSSSSCVLVSLDADRRARPRQGKEEEGRPRKRRRTVTFRDDMLCIDQTISEVYDNATERWVSKQDLKTYRADIVNTLKVIQSAQKALLDDESEGVCTRGVEALLDHHAKRGKRRNVIRAVLKFQKLQRNMKYNDPELLAKIYRSYSKSSVNHALRLAIQDQRDVLAEQGCHNIDGEGGPTEMAAANITAAADPPTLTSIASITSDATTT